MSEEMTSLEALKKRHRDEQKSLQSQIQALKKSLNKNDKKRKKEVQEQIQNLEAALVQRHKQELQDFENGEAEKVELSKATEDGGLRDDDSESEGWKTPMVAEEDVPRGPLVASESELSGFPLDSTAGDLILPDPATPSLSITAPSLSTPSASMSTLTPDFGEGADTSSMPGTESETGGGKKSKAQRRREQKERKEREREQRILDEEETNKRGARHIEAEKLRRILAIKNQAVHEVPANGHCLYSAVADQLRRRKEKRETIEDLRERAAAHMRTHREDFLPFLTDPNTGEPMTEEAFDGYCDRVAKTTAWGGQLEIRALANVFKIPIEIVQADGPVVNVGGQEFGSESPLILSYHRHFYRLGEHYNSVIDKVGDSEAEEESVGSLSI